MLDWWNSFAGIGGWFFILLLDVGLTSWLLFDSQRRRAPTVGWRIAMIVLTLLVLPSAAIRGLNVAVRYQTRELLSWLGLVFGGLLPLSTAAGYVVAVVNAPALTAVAAKPAVPQQPPAPAAAAEGAKAQDLPHAEPVAPPPQAPAGEARAQDPPRPEPASRPLQREPVTMQAGPGVGQRPRGPAQRQQANAWLVLDEGEGRKREFRLYCGDVRIGRRKQGNDVVLEDASVSREHALIREENGYFTLFDRGASAGTFVNGHRVREPILLQDGDVLLLGEIRLRFVKLD